MKTLLLFLSFLVLTFQVVLGQTRKDSLYVFIGEKIEVIPFKPKVDSNQILMDAAFKAKYKVIQSIFGKYNKDTIEFEAYDHYGMPQFSTYRYVLLYVSNYNNKLYHEKYQFADVYKTKSGRWASGYRTEDYEHPYNQNIAIKPEPIDFAEEVFYNVQGRTKEDIVNRFPAPYYKIEGNKAIAVWGNYVEQLFELKKSGILKARNFF